MLVNKAVKLAVLTAAAILCGTSTEAAPSAFKLCGRKLSEIMSRVCHVYNSPSWDVPTVVEQPTATLRRKRQVGIADECCTYGCTWEQLSEYCSVTSESLLDGLETHMIADRSAEKESGPSVVASPAAIGSERGAVAAARGGKRREVGRERSGGYGRGRRGRRRGRRCWCRRKRRSGRRRSDLMESRKKCCARCARSGHRVASAHLGKDPQH